MSNGLGPLSLCLIKAGGPAVQDWHSLWVGGVQSREQGFAKEIMQPIAAPLLVQGHQEEVRSLQPFQHLLADPSFRLGGHRLAYRGVQAREDGGMQ